MTTRERVTVSVVAGRRPELVRDFLLSLYSEAPENTDLFVVVTLNAPDPLCRDAVITDAEAAGWAARLEIRMNEHPLGFAANHNRTMLAHPADFYLICNDDVVVLRGAIDKMLEYVRDPVNERIGVVSPLLLNADRTVQGSTYSFPSPLRSFVAAADLRANRVFGALIDRAARSAAPGRSRSWAHDRTMLVDSVRGAFVLVRHEAVAEAGLMDEIALVGGEDVEWHRRMAEKGWRVAFVHDAAVIHLGGETVSADPALRIEYAKGWLNYFQKHGRAVDVLAIRAGLGMIYGARFVLGLLSAGDTRRVNRAGLRLSARWPAIWREAVNSGQISGV